MNAKTPAPGGRFGPEGRDRRRRHRAKVAVPVHIRGGMGSPGAFEDVGTTIDASSDGLLVATMRGGYRNGQVLNVTLACAGEPTAVDLSQRACVVRNVLMPDHLSYAVALEYRKSGVNAKDEHLSDYLPMVVRVLVVESDPRVASLTRDLLLQDGYRVVHVSTGKDALDVLSAEPPDVLLADVEGGEVNGQELCSIMKKNIRLQHIPVILLTHSAQAADYSACHQAGAVICMAMPCLPEKLRQVVRFVAPLLSSQSRSYNGEVNISGFVRTQ
jgi:CheY-like chemotaxis protein